MEPFRRFLNRKKVSKKAEGQSFGIPMDLFLESAGRAKDRGVLGNSMMLGQVVSIARRKAKLTVFELAAKSGKPLETIIDLSLGMLPLNEAVGIAEALKAILPIYEKAYKSALFIDLRKK